jgi:hypothetical protein
VLVYILSPYLIISSEYNRDALPKKYNNFNSSHIGDSNVVGNITETLKKIGIDFNVIFECGV